MTNNNIKNLRKKLHWTQFELSNWIGLTSGGTEISKIETGRVSPSNPVKKLLQILEVFSRNNGIYIDEKVKGSLNEARSTTSN